jgi:hypothetical protein
VAAARELAATPDGQLLALQITDGTPRYYRTLPETLGIPYLRIDLHDRRGPDGATLTAGRR